MSLVRQMFHTDLKGSFRHSRKGEYLNRDQDTKLMRILLHVFSVLETMEMMPMA